MAADPVFCGYQNRDVLIEFDYCYWKFMKLVQGIEQIFDHLYHLFELQVGNSVCVTVFFYEFRSYVHGDSFRLGQYFPAKYERAVF